MVCHWQHDIVSSSTLAKRHLIDFGIYKLFFNGLMFNVKVTLVMEVRGLIFIAT